MVSRIAYCNVRWRIIGGEIGCRSIRAPENSIAWLICVKPAACTIASRPIPDGLHTPRYSHIPVSRIALKPRQSDSSDARGRETRAKLIAMDSENPENPTIFREIGVNRYSIWSMCDARNVFYVALKQTKREEKTVKYRLRDQTV